MLNKLTTIALPGWFCILVLFATGCASESSPTLPPTQPPPVFSPTPSASPHPSYTARPIPPTATSSPTITLTPLPTSTPTITPFPTKVVDDHGIPLVLVPAGPFEMGRNDRAKSERPSHAVTLNAFYIDQFEVTFDGFAAFLNAMGNQFEGNANWVEANDPDLRIHLVEGIWQVDQGFEKYPMNEVTWYGARAYCEWRGARLPTEAEWEKAARGTDGRTYPWGEDISCEKANYASCFYDAVPVDSFPGSVSPYGAYNMAGNSMEWVADLYSPDYYANSPAENPAGPESGDFRLIRGGSWINAAGNTRTTHRFPKLPVLTFKSTGFRCARSASP